ncbi:WXG100 family type VII secretion target [Saccharopolyspora flava]|uniref:Outer membrane channel protein CpnT-like N-terminal domain-containing protein n=1 Tax=Saccharopolyspora flava TaxID=95161 RepID=A0A1I6TYH3_9PSEU|nr:WXG100 family type VII secretion target [Saccharopolyspora flava]SFS94230.1 hypothetical protein SAMN05660874_04421 [Saccharopolyspora flava]
MSIEMPDEVKWLLPIVVGQSWPEGDEDAMRRMADAWRTAADGIDAVQHSANAGAQQVKSAMEGQTADAFSKLWKDIGDGGDSALPKLKEACEKLAKSCDDAALDVEHTKLTIIASLIALAIQIAAMIAAAPATFGASTAGIAAAQGITRAVVLQIFKQLVFSILKNVAIEVASSVAIEFAVQGTQVAMGTRDGLDGGKFKEAAISGAIGGAVGGVFEGAGKAFGKGAGSALGGAAGNAAGDVTGEAAESAVKSIGKEAVKEGALGAAEGAVGSAAEQLITEGKLDWSEIGTGAMSGGATGSLMGGIGGAKEHFGGDVDVPDADGGSSGDSGGSSSDSGGSSSDGSSSDSGSSSDGGSSDSGSSDGGSSDSGSSSDGGSSDSSSGSGSSESSSSDSGSSESSSSDSGSAESRSSSPDSGTSDSGSSTADSGSSASDSSSPSTSDSGSQSSSDSSSDSAPETRSSADSGSSSDSGSSRAADSGGSSSDSGVSTASTSDSSSSSSGSHASDAPSSADTSSGSDAGSSSDGGSSPDTRSADTGSSSSSGSSVPDPGRSDAPSSSESSGASSNDSSSSGGSSGGAGMPHAGGGGSSSSHSGGSGSGSFSGTLPVDGDRAPSSPASTAAANVDAPAAPTTPAPGPAGPAPAAPRADQPAAGGPIGGGMAGGAPSAPGGAGATPSAGGSRTGGGGGWTGTAGSPGAAARPMGGDLGPRPDSPRTPSRGADTPSRPDTGVPQQRTSRPDSPTTTRPDGPGQHPGGSSAETPGQHPDGADSPTQRPDGADSPDQRPDASDSDPQHHEGPQQHEDPDGTRPGEDEHDGPDHDTDQPHDAEPGTPERQEQIDQAESTRQETQAGSSFHDDPRMRDLADRVPDDGVHHTVDAHALPDGRVRIGDHTFSAKEFADMLRRDPNFDGSKPVRLLSCDAGTSGLARDLSNELGVPVTAPTGLAWTDGNGRVFATDMGPDGKPGWPPNGTWNTHHPDGTTTPASNDGFHPTKNSEDPGQRPDNAESRGGENTKPSGWDVSEAEQIGARSPYDEPYIPKDPQHGFKVEDIAEDRVTRGSDGLIDTVDGKPIHQYTRQSIEQRQQSIQNAIDENRKIKNPKKAPFAEVGEGRMPYSYKSLGGKPGAVNAIVIDRSNGLVYEGINGVQGNTVPTTTTTTDGTPATGMDAHGNKFNLTDEDLLHPALRDHISNMAENPGRPVNQIEQGEFPHRDLPHRHGEVKALDGILKQREEIAAAEARRSGEGVDQIEKVTRGGREVEIIRIKPEELQGVVNELSVDARFTFKKDPDDVAACCANCARIVAGPDSLPKNVRDAADLSHGAQMNTGGYTAGVHTDKNNLDPDSENTNRRHESIYNSDYNQKFTEQQEIRAAKEEARRSREAEGSS